LGYRSILRISVSVVLFLMLLNVLVLRDSPYPLLRTVFGYAFIIITAVLLVLLYLHRYRP
jgi:hypothetical protein